MQDILSLDITSIFFKKKIYYKIDQFLFMKTLLGNCVCPKLSDKIPIGTSSPCRNDVLETLQRRLTAPTESSLSPGASATLKQRYELTTMTTAILHMGPCSAVYLRRCHNVVKRPTPGGSSESSSSNGCY